MSLITPALMFVIAALDFAVAIRQAMAEDHAYAAAGPFWQPWLVPFLGGPAAVMIGWLAVVPLGLTGRRWAAAAIASVLLALGLLNLLVEVMQQAGAWSGGLPMFLYTTGQGPVFIASLAACSLAFSAGPRRVVVTRVPGTVGRRVSALVAVPALLLDAVSIPFGGSSAATLVLLAGSLLLAVLVWPAAIASWRARVRRSSHALPT